jgi:hypothetical protein
MGTSAQRQLSISSRSATKVSVAEPLATPGTSAYPWYWPRTQCWGSAGGMARNTSAFLSCVSPALAPAGGSMATRASTCSRWFWTTSLSTPTES